MPRKGMRSNFLTPPSPSNSSQTKPINTFSYSIMVQNIENAELVIKKCDLEGSALFSGDRSEAIEFLKSVSDVQSAMQLILSEDSNSDILVRAHNLMEMAMNRLQKEFQQILSGTRAFDADSVSSMLFPLDFARSSTSDIDDVSEVEIQAVVDSVSETEKASEIAVKDLKSIAGVMISIGYGKECVTIYKAIRKSIVDESLYNLGFEKLSLSKLKKMNWESIEIKIRSWLRSVKTVVTSLFLGEKIICEHVFSMSPMIAESCFTDIVRDGARNLFKFPENVAKYKKLTLEKLFQILDLYEVLSELWPEIESIFSYESFTHIRSQAINSLIRLGEATRYILTDFEAAIQKDASKSVPGGGVHPLTRYVMNYMIMLSDYSGILSDILAYSSLSVRSPMPESYFSSPLVNDDLESLLSVKFAWIILLLLCKLDVKVGLYNDVALSYLFLANNLNYVVSKVRNSNLRILLGDEWLVNQEKKVRQYAGNYERIGWSKVMSSLVNPTADISAEELKESIGKFSTAFEEAYQKQRSWVVPEQKLRYEIKISLVTKLGPKYRVVYEQYRLKKGMIGIECLVRYAPDNLGNYISDLFCGDENSVGMSSLVSSTSSSPRGGVGR